MQVQTCPAMYYTFMQTQRGTFLPPESFEINIHAFIISRLDFYFINQDLWRLGNQKLLQPDSSFILMFSENITYSCCYSPYRSFCFKKVWVIIFGRADGTGPLTTSTMTVSTWGKDWNLSPVSLRGAAQKRQSRPLLLFNTYGNVYVQTMSKLCLCPIISFNFSLFLENCDWIFT